MKLLAADDVPDAFAPGLSAQDFAPGALVVIDLDRGVRREWPADLQLAGRILVGRSHSPLSGPASVLADRLTLTVAPGGDGRAWVDEDDVLDAVESACVAHPVAASVLDRLLRSTAEVSVETALELESLAYSTLLASAEFRRWREDVPRPDRTGRSGAVLVERLGDLLTLTLDRPDRHNAFDREMRDQLVAALRLARADDTLRQIDLVGAGPSFCSGGDRAEFGVADDPAFAHLIRLERSAGHAVYLLRRRVRPRLHGACIGAGIEVPAFAAHVSAQAGTWFALPELAMGLVPGAGGTVSVPRRIGRWRTAYMALTGRRVDAATALSWGLVDEL